MPARRRVRPGSGPGAALGLAGALLAGACASAPPPPPPAPDPALLASLRAAVPMNPIAVDEDPYPSWAGRRPPPPPPGSVCGARLEADRVRYRLQTFAGEDEARRAGYQVTHTGTCGACSTFQDLAVYLERPDLTTPVRRCGMTTAPNTLACLEALGFSHACAQIWLFNVENTRRACFAVCMKSWMSGEPSTTSDGKLNECLQCDEDRSGPVFKAVAGRTRRNSGIRSSIPRPDEEVAHLVHEYFGPPSP